ncbi:hypothetical protein RND81_08G015900 [Saponaria officinalis]|uniref:Nuclear pore complex protein NUP1-like n=1 Tax=Saponaria officinalis TaxID=3572 RepID=A0AAW1J2H5_SAPOF
MASSSTPATVAYEPNNGGAGGKFRKKPFRKPPTTPYDRPLTAFRPIQNTNNNDNDGWLSKIVNPASKIITSGAHKIFASVFRKGLLPPPSSPPLRRTSGEVNEMEYMQPETAANVADSATKLPVDNGGNDCSGPSYSNGVAELEDILKQKTFTRSEIDQLTALMLSRTSDNSDGAEKKKSEPNFSDLRDIHAKSVNLPNLPRENHNEHVLRGDISTPQLRSRVHPGEVASPAEIAKAYMASRPTEVSPSVLRLENQLPKEDSSTPYNPSAKSISPAMYLTQKAVNDIGVSRNGFMTPRSQGRSAIYRTSRTPYSRIYPVTASKAAETNLSNGGGSSCHNLTENNYYKKQALKRRSSVLEKDIGSVGPIRRIRQKSNFFHRKTLSLPPPNGHQAMHASSVVSDVSDLRSTLECSSQNRSFSKALGVNNLPGTSGRYVSSQSIKMAQRIFEQLDNLSPKGNSNKKADVSAGTSSMVKEDYLKMDDDVPSNVVALSTSLTEGRQHAESPRKSVAIPHILQRDQKISVEKPLETKSAAQLKNSEFESVANGCSAFETTVSFPSVISSPSPSDMTMPDAINTRLSTKQSDKVAPQHGKSNIFTAFSSKSDNLSPVVHTPTAVKDTKVEIPVSTNKTAAEVVPDKTIIKSTPESDNTFIKSGDIPFVNALPNGLQTNNTTLLSGVLSTLPATSASNTTDNSCQKLTAVGLSHVATSVLDTKSSTLASGGNGVFSFPASTVASVSAPVSTSVPSFPVPSTSPSTSTFGLSGSIGLSQGPVFGSDSSSLFNAGPTAVSSGLGSSFTSSSFVTSSSTTPSIFGFTSQSPKSTTIGLSGSSDIGTGPIFGSGSANPFTSSLASTSSSITPSIFGFTSQSPKPSTTTVPTSPSPTFSFGLESTGATTTSSFIFGATTNSSSASNSAPFVFGGNSSSTPSTPASSISCFQSQPAFSNATSQPFVFASNPSTNVNQMTVEETMTENSPPPAFGTPLSATSVPFAFNAAPPASSVFQFNTQQSPVAPQNPPFQPSGSLEFYGGTSSFSLGTSDKSQRRIIRVKKGARRK